MTAILLGWVIYRLASALVDVAIVLDGWAYRRQRRAIRVYEAPTVLDCRGWERDRLRIGGAAGPTQTPVAVPRMAAAPPPPALPDGTRPFPSPAGGSHPKRGRHASGRVLWFPDWLRWLWPLEVTA